ncbi:MAG: hypothetical protein HY010_03110 [Acidobacteria bacterium]|nr:hypothetical protein [Acidobacteriota bacterium]
MKKFAICLAVLAVAALMVPGAQAAGPKCYHFTNFCDVIQATQVHVGGIQGNEVVGLWDAFCIGAGSGTLISGGPGKVGTQIVYPYVGGFAYGIQANFTFKNSTHLFDLYGTFDGLTTGAFQTNQPFTTTNGACNPLGHQAPGKKSSIGMR